ncbi:MAG: hypothetical protein J6V50_00005, partial [Clostridia bacterium]|nr:hypothetical protein [Clostridia bacterium]
ERNFDFHNKFFDASQFSLQSDDITIPEIDRFVGKNHEQITPKFITIQQKGKKLIWCLPAFLFGLFFGLPGVALWFLYRKMTKPAALILLAALLFETVKMFFLFGATSEYYSMIFEGLRYYTQLILQNPEGAIEWLVNYFAQATNNMVEMMVDAFPAWLSTLEMYIIDLAAPIFISLLGLLSYKNHTIKKISELKKTSVDETVYAIKLRREGGTSVGRAVLGILIYGVLSFTISAIPLIAVLFGM